MTLVPTAALADNDYTGGDNPTTCDVSGAVPGGTFPCSVTGADGQEAGMSGTFSTGDEVGIAGATATVTKAVSGGSADFSISVPESDGTLSLTTYLDGEAVDSMTLAVVDGAAVPVAVDAEDLSQTGFTNMPLLVGVGLLLAAGGGAVVYAGRKARQDSTPLAP
ncbi:hypothetical protein GCM10025876_14150 [Demequina litorisediminis]|uniref:LPXTG cell wall anchor domain-containing protein n=1 Tax=Demequina litorisediminis TaxID=1849022 RepID=A0ABQ6ICQ1_9MICO|nr:hypothetical protein GCM10025876_14150 [Demequina litorisediminis]